MTHTKIRESILQLLSAGSRNQTSLVEYLCETHTVTKQAVYKEIRNLLALEYITVIHKQVSFSLPYLANKIREFKEIESIVAAELTLASTHKNSFTIRFKTLARCEIFWTQFVINMLPNITPGSINYSIQPHYFYIYARPDTNIYWEKAHKDHKIKQRFICTHPSQLDKQLLNELDTRLDGIHEHSNVIYKLKIPSNIYYSVVGDCICKVTFDPVINQKFEKLIKEQKSYPLTEEAALAFSDLMHETGTFIFTWKRNAVQAEQLTRKVRDLFE